MEDALKKINELEQKFNSFLNDPRQIDHQHNGFDMTRIEYIDIAQKKVYVSHTIQGTAAATAANYGVFFVAMFPCVVTGFKEVHQTAGTDGSAVTLMLEKLEDTVAPDSGDDVLSTALSLKSTANTVQSGALTLTLADKTLKIGDRLCLKDAGTLTSVANLTISLELMVL